MTQRDSATVLTFFRLTLVVLGIVLVSVATGWGYNTHKQHLAEAAIDASFDEYNRYIATCAEGEQASDVAWDLAERANAALRKASLARDVYEERANDVLWFGLLAVPVIVILFYAFRWAMTGRLRPLWLLGRGSGVGSRFQALRTSM